MRRRRCSTSRATSATCTRPTVAIVGARNGSAAGQKLARMFAARIGRAGFVIASGLARGIDAAAHEAALEHGTVAVLAGGIDNIYPPEHAELQRAIGERGCLVSENAARLRAARARTFPRRNRIISGIVAGRADRRGGAAIGNARSPRALAAEQGREVFAVPGHPLDPRAEGTNRLLKTGATMVTEPEDVIDGPGADAGASALGRTVQAREEPTAAEIAGRRPRAGSPQVATAGPRPAAGRARAGAGRHRRAGARPRACRHAPLQIALIELALAGRIERHGHQLVSLAARGVRPLSLTMAAYSQPPLKGSDPFVLRYAPARLWRTASP